MRKVFNYGIYLSLLFLGITLYKADYLALPRVYSITPLAISLLLLFSGYFVSGLVWRQLLRKNLYQVSISVAVSSGGLSVFGKYIPGKIWAVLGRAAYISERYKYPVQPLSMLSIQAQFLEIWAGLALGGIGLILLGEFQEWGGWLLALWLFLSIIVFTPSVKHVAERIIDLLFKRKITLPSVQNGQTLRLIPWFLATWIFWSLGFYFFVSSVMESHLSISIAFGFPLSVSFGIAAIIVPGGLGVREGVMVAYLVLAGISLQEATMVSVAARLWTLVGEIFIFVLSLVLAHLSRKKQAPVGN